MSLLRKLRLRSIRFSRGERGTAPIEAVIITPILFWWYLAAYQYFDAFREKNANQKAAYAISDLISRETEEINTAYIDRMRDVFDYMTLSRKPSWIRVTSVYWDTDTNTYKVVWSHATGGHQPQNNSTIAVEASRIPVLPKGDTIILVETQTEYQPFFRIGLSETKFGNFITTSPRFASQVVFEGQALPEAVPTPDVSGT